MSMDWQKWEKTKGELQEQIGELRKSREKLTAPELEPLRNALDKLVGDLEKVIEAGEMERKIEQGGAVPGPDSKQ